MTIRTRVTLISAAAMTALAATVAAVLFFAEARDLRSQADAELTARVTVIIGELRSTGDVHSLLNPPFGVQAAYAQLVDSDSQVVQLAPGFPRLPITERDLAVTRGESSRFFASTEVETVHLRMLTVPYQPGMALQVARPVDVIDLSLLRFGGIAVLVVLAAAAIGLLLGRGVARSALKPVAELTAAAELVASTHDLAHRIEVSGDAELTGLADSMNSMVVALDEAVRSQQQLIADASHELQTPITVLRTNVALLQRANEMPDDERRLVLSDMAAELINLSRLATNLVDLARDPGDPRDFQLVDIATVIEEQIDTARRSYPGVVFKSETDTLVVMADPDQTRRMIRNLIDNAAEWTGKERKVEVKLREGVLTVRDHGPGVSPEDIPNLFERFYRAVPARALPGSGLGLAIVAKAATEHGWSVQVDNAVDGGAVFTVSFGNSEISDLEDNSLRGAVRTSL